MKIRDLKIITLTALRTWEKAALLRTDFKVTTSKIKTLNTTAIFSLK